MARRKYAKYMALAGAVQGVGQGILQGIEARRQQSLLEIQEKYRQQERAEDRRVRKEENEADREFRLNLEDTRQSNRMSELERAEALRRETKRNDPGLAKDFTGDSLEQYREGGYDIALLDPRVDSADMPADWRSTRLYMAASEEEREVYDRINKIGDKGLTDKDRSKSVNDLYEAFAKLPKYERRDRIKTMGLPEDLTGQDLEKAVIDYYRETVNYIAPLDPEPTGIGLFRDNPGQEGQPGSSRENPVDATQLTAPPPSGTWVRRPDGTVAQVR